ncbi:MAG: hypothetical protein AAF514_12880, partial [Verrucomicrobiota bacterium]
DSEPIWEQVTVNLPPGDHRLSFTAFYGQFELDGFSVSEETLPWLEAINDPAGLWVFEGPLPTTSDRSLDGASLFSELSGRDEMWARFLRWFEGPGLVRMRWRLEGDGELRNLLPDSVPVDEWNRSRFLVTPTGRFRPLNHRRSGGTGSSRFYLDDFAVEEVSVEGLVGVERWNPRFETSHPEGSWSPTSSSADPQNDDGAVAFLPGQGNESGTLTATFPGSGLLSFSWSLWADQGEHLTVDVNGQSILSRASGQVFGFLSKGHRLTAASNEVVWKFQYRNNPYNPSFLDDILFSRPVEPEVSAFLGRPGLPVYAHNAVVENGVSPGDGVRLSGTGPRPALSVELDGNQVIAFQWKADLPPGAKAVFFDGGWPVAEISGTTPLEKVARGLSGGDHVLRWELIANEVALGPEHGVSLKGLTEVSSGPAPGEAVDDAGNRAWVLRGGVAVRSPAVPDLVGGDGVVVWGANPSRENTGYLETIFEGAGELTFRVRGQEGPGAGSYGLVRVGGEPWALNREGGDGAWNMNRVAMVDGRHVVRWLAGRGSEMWVDEVRFQAVARTPLAEALDAPDLLFDEPGSPWFPGEFSTSSDGEDSVLLGAFREEPAPIGTTVEGPGRFSFRYRGDSLVMNVGALGRHWFGPSADWTTAHYILPPGRHEVRWTASSYRAGLQLDALQEEAMDGDLIGEGLDSPGLSWSGYGVERWERTVDPGRTVDGEDAVVLTGGGGNGLNYFRSVLSAPVEGPARLCIHARFSGPADGFYVSVTDSSGIEQSQTAATGGWQVYEFNIRRGRSVLSISTSGLFAGDELLIDQLTLEPGTVPLGEATGSPGLTWETGGDVGWSGQVSSGGLGDGVEAVSGDLGPGQSSWLATTIEGPARFSFHWDSANKAGVDQILFQINGKTRSSLPHPSVYSGVFSVGPGTHLLRWVFLRSSGANSGVERAVYLRDFSIVTDPQAWALAKGVAEAEILENFDPDGDGLNNLMEFALGRHPLRPDPDVLSARPARNDEGGIGFSRLRIQDDWEVVLEVSPDLKNWERPEVSRWGGEVEHTLLYHVRDPFESYARLRVVENAP